MKIMICISQLKKGGAERVVTNLANYFIEKHDVTIVSLKHYEPEYQLESKIKVINLDKNNRQNKFIKIFKRVFTLNNNIKIEKPDIILSFLPEPSFLVLLLKKFRKNKVIVSVRNDPKIEYKSKIYKLAMKLLYPLADGFVFQTKEAQSYFSEKIQKKSTIILNSLNPDFLIERFKGERNKQIVSVGRLFEQKNHELLIKAFDKVHQMHPEYELVIYGEGPLRQKLEELIKSLKLEDSIKLPGVESEIKEKIYKSSIFVLSSNYEGMPNSLMEALTLGLPCVATNCPCGGPNALINDGVDGILTEVGNVDMLANKINMLIENKELCDSISNKASENIKKLDPKIINREWEEYLTYIANK